MSRRRFLPTFCLAVTLFAAHPFHAAALGITPPESVSFATVTLSGRDLTTTATPAVAVSNRGAGSTGGWSLSLSTTAFSGPAPLCGRFGGRVSTTAPRRQRRLRGARDALPAVSRSPTR